MDTQFFCTMTLLVGLPAGASHDIFAPPVNVGDLGPRRVGSRVFHIGRGNVGPAELKAGLSGRKLGLLRPGTGPGEKKVGARVRSLVGGFTCT